MTAIEEVAAERKRQRTKERWSLAHDDGHDDGSLAAAAACYAHPARIFIAEQLAGRAYQTYTSYRDAWPESWAGRWWKPKSRRRNLVRAAALIIAEIERIDRATKLKRNQSRR
jgi:hypothetical protein